MGITDSNTSDKKENKIENKKIENKKGNKIENKKTENKKTESKQKKKQVKPAYFIPYILGTVLVCVLVFASLSYFRSLKEGLFVERQSHLIELTQKISDVINAEIGEAQEKTDVAKQLMMHITGADKESLTGSLKEIDSLLDLSEGVVLAMDEQGKYYSSEGKSANWQNLKDLATEDVTPKVRELEVFGEEQACMVFFRELDEQVLVDGMDNAITHVAIAIPTSSLEETFALSVYGNECYAYLVKQNGRRLYKSSLEESLISDVNVISALSDENFLMGGDLDDLVQAMEARESYCLEFEFTDTGEDYFLSTVPVTDSEWMVFLFVPTRVLGAATNSVLTMSIRYFAGVAAIFCILCGGMIFVIAAGKNNRKMMQQQEENNRLLKEAAEEAQKANAAKSEFLSRMSHDIRTPINGIIGMADIAIKNKDDMEKVKDCLTKVNNAAEHLKLLVNDVLDMSSIESGHLTIAHQKMDVRHLLSSSVSLVEGQILMKQLKFREEFEEFKNPFVYGDELHLRQVFVNILGNAVKFTPDGGTVVFRAQELVGSKYKTRYRFQVLDTGIGMSKEFQKRIFDTFAQENSGSRTNYNGTGLGMSITKQYVDRMNGTIDVQSTQGKGSCFTVELIFEIAPEDVVKEQEGEGWDLKDMKILIVEDNELNMEIAQEVLEDEGAVVSTAENGRLGLERFIKAGPGTFDAILMDVMMPEMNGYEATRAIRASGHPDARTIPIIAMTANAYEQDVQAAFSSGMNAHIAKPIELERLYKTLDHFRRNPIGEENQEEDKEKNQEEDKKEE